MSIDAICSDFKKQLDQLEKVFILLQDKFSFVCTNSNEIRFDNKLQESIKNEISLINKKMNAATSSLYALQECKEKKILIFLKDSFEFMTKQGWDIIKTISEFLLKYEIDTAKKSTCVNFGTGIDHQEEVKGGEGKRFNYSDDLALNN